MGRLPELRRQPPLGPIQRFTYRFYTLHALPPLPIWEVGEHQARLEGDPESPRAEGFSSGVRGRGRVGGAPRRSSAPGERREWQVREQVQGP